MSSSKQRVVNAGTEETAEKLPDQEAFSSDGPIVSAVWD